MKTKINLDNLSKLPILFSTVQQSKLRLKNSNIYSSFYQAEEFNAPNFYKLTCLVYTDYDRY